MRFYTRVWQMLGVMRSLAFTNTQDPVEAIDDETSLRA